MAPDRSDLQGMTQGDKETFKEYAQRWRNVAAQVSPRIEEKEMTKLFLKTLNQFYYKKMIGSAPKNFEEMVGMVVQLEEGVREGRLIMESVLASSSNKFGNNFPRKNEQEVSMVAQGRPQQKYLAYQHIDAVTPATTTIQQPGYQPQYPQQPYHQQQPRQQASRAQFAPIPVKYDGLLPQLLERNLVQTKAPPPVPTRLPAWYRPDLFCTFHQGAPGHDIEHCNAMK
jgi:hypothetical protein